MHMGHRFCTHLFVMSEMSFIPLILVPHAQLYLFEAYAPGVKLLLITSH